MKIGLGIGIPFIRNYVSSIVFDPSKLFTGSTNGVWYDPSDLTTLYRDAAGTLPVTAVEQPVGLMLDKRDTTYSTYFDETGDYLTLPTNQSALAFGSGDFTVEAWVYTASSARQTLFCGQSDTQTAANSSYVFYVGGSTTCDLYSGSGAYSIAPVVPTTNTWSHIVYVRKGGAFSSFLNGSRVSTRNDLGAASLNTGATTYAPSIGALSNAGIRPFNGYISNLRVVKGTAIYDATQTTITVPTAPLTAVPGTSLLTCGTSWSGNPAITNNGNTRADKLNPFTTGTGNHAFNSSGNSANFPVLSARYNLLTKTESLTDAAWTKTAGVTVTDNAAVAPDGTTTATTIAFGGFGREIAQSFSATNAITAPTFYVKGTAGQVLNFGAAGQNRSITLTGGWDLASSTLPAGSTKFYIGNYEVGANALNISVWHPDLRVANDALNQPTYQRVNTATDYDTVGFKPYLRFNGTNQWLQTNSIDFTYTDKMFVSAGVRKLQESGASAQIICELSADAGTNNGGFYLTGWNGYQSPNHRYAMSSRGTASATSAETSASYAAPITNILSGIGNISGDQAILRVNGTQAAISTADQGTGNYGNYPLYIGARAGTSLWFNGRLYSLIVAGKLANAVEITETEKYVNGKTAAY